ncbi:RNA-guided endonuclease TnpB family protein, partial [Thermotoga sp.]|uniref:RNA-guided endonuclease InsQ/TnpB family protein n=1 Tax=Thermotoga sp. TaxID=28240 RepID=UPI0025DF1579
PFNKISRYFVQYVVYLIRKLHKVTANFIEWVKNRGTATIVIGNVKGIRNKAKYNKVVNQKIHSWLFGKTTALIEYKAEAVGIRVEYISEEYTSQTCPVCGHRHKPSNRNFRCPVCGFEYHRDGVGAINIYKKYTGYGLVVADLTPAVGVRFSSHLRGPGISPWKLALSQ